MVARVRFDDDKPAKKKLRITPGMVASAKARLTNRPRLNPYTIPAFPPGVGPTDRNERAQIAMDANTNINNANNFAWTANAGYISAYNEGLAFPGYPFLSELAQRPEYRRMVEIIGTEMTRKWIKLQSVGDEDKTIQIKQLDDELDRLCVRDHFRKIADYDGYFGRGHLYIDTGDTDNREELRLSIGNGRDDISRAKVRKGKLLRLKAVEPVWTYPTNYDSADPLRTDWYEPDTWFVMAKEIHSSRLLKFVGREVPDLLKPAYSFGGLSMSQMAMPYVNNWLRTRQSVADLIHAFSVFVLETDLSESLEEGGEQLFERLELFNIVRDNRGVMAINKDSEGFQNVSASLGSLDHLQAQTQEHMASVSGVPIVKLLGIQPAGLNASSEGEIRTFYDWIHAFQEKLFTANLTRIIDFAQLNIWGVVDPGIRFIYEPLWSLDEKGAAEVQQIKAQTGTALVDSGIISQEEERKRLIADPNSGYNSLKVEDLPDLEDEEAEGLVPEHGGGATKEAMELGIEKEEPEQEPGESERQTNGDAKVQGQQISKQAPKVSTGTPSKPRLDVKPPSSKAHDEASFKEEQHPRRDDGKFGKGGGGKSGSSAPGKSASSANSTKTSTGQLREQRVNIKATKNKAWTGAQQETNNKLSKQEVGAIGENIAIAFLKAQGYTDSGAVNSHLKNFPIDLIQDHELIEVKTGLVSNSNAAQQWRATIGQPGKAETEWLKTASPEQKAIHNAKKKAAIMERKNAVIKEFSKNTGKKFKGRTLTLIINPDTKTADIHMFDGFHHRIGWNSDEAKQSYKGSFNYA